jgi:predicted DCC family thiol-disulfide oxidoreductase YuxK
VTLAGESPRTLDRTAAAALLARLEREVAREELLLDQERRAIDDGTAVHELIHLVSANSGLLPRHDAFPRWLQEGLAMQFELIRGGRWAGIGRAHDLRLPDWRKLQPPPPLEALVRDAGLNRGYRRDPYAAAWSLVYFLRTRRPAEFLRFLDLLRSPDADLADRAVPDRFLTAFQRSFGDDLARLEHDWHVFMSTVQTPLERNSPEPRSTEAASAARSSRDRRPSNPPPTAGR